MADGKNSYEWNFWASSFALLANCNRDPKKSKPFTPSDFHPYLQATKKKQGIGGFLSAMKSVAKRNRFKLRLAG